MSLEKNSENICVIIPVFNESRQIAKIVKQIRERDLDVVVIDDGSTDGSEKLAFAAGAVVIRNQERNGKGYSLQKGFAYAVKDPFLGVVTMDGDGQHDPADLDVLIQKAHTYPHAIIVGNRMVDHRGMPWIRILTNRFMSFLISRYCHQYVPDTQCGFRYIPCEILRQLALTANAYEIETEVLIKASKLGFRIYSFPIKTIYGDEKSRINPFKDTYRFIKYLMRETRGF